MNPDSENTSETGIGPRGEHKVDSDHSLSLAQKRAGRRYLEDSVSVVEGGR
jgi:hypothetical protein